MALLRFVTGQPGGLACAQGRSDGGISVYIPTQISPPKIFMGYSSSYEAEHQLATAS